jgi:hypothetical protein
LIIAAMSTIDATSLYDISHSTDEIGKDFFAAFAASTPASAGEFCRTDTSGARLRL